MKRTPLSITGDPVPSQDSRLPWTGSSNYTRHATYSRRKVRLPNASTFGSCKWEASPGDIVRWRYSNDVEGVGRVIGRVDAPFVPDSQYPCEKVVGYIAAVELAQCFTAAYVRWIDPAIVVECREAPKALPAWFFGELPHVTEILRLQNLGALSESYINKYSRPENDT